MSKCFFISKFVLLVSLCSILHAGVVTYDANGYLESLTGVYVDSPKDSQDGWYDVTFINNSGSDPNYVLYTESGFNDAAQDALFNTLVLADGAIGTYGFNQTELILVPGWASGAWAFTLHRNNPDPLSESWTSNPQPIPAATTSWAVFSHGVEPTASVPEPSTYLMLTLGILGFGIYRRKRK